MNDRIYWKLVHTWHHWLMGWVYIGTGVAQVASLGLWWPDAPGAAAVWCMRRCMRYRKAREARKYQTRLGT